MGKDYASPRWLITVEPVGPNRWQVIVKNAGRMSSVFVPLSVKLSGGMRKVEIADLRFVSLGRSDLNPGEEVRYELSAEVFGEPIELRLSINYLAIGDWASVEESFYIPVLKN